MHQMLRKPDFLIEKTPKYPCHPPIRKRTRPWDSSGSPKLKTTSQNPYMMHLTCNWITNKLISKDIRLARTSGEVKAQENVHKASMEDKRALEGFRGASWKASGSAFVVMSSMMGACQ